MREISEEQLQERMMETRELIDRVEDVIDGEQIGVIISGLLFLLAEMYDEEIMPLDRFIDEIGKSVRNFVTKRDQQGEIQWLQ